MKPLTILILSLFCAIYSKAQPWSGSAPGDIYYNSGNVGIGTTSPSTKLEVVNSSNSLLNVLSINNNLTNTSAQSNGAAITIGQSGNYYNKIATVYEQSNPAYLQPALAFYTMHDTYLAGSEVERMRISSIGNIGIGTITPTGLLHIKALSPVFKIQTSGAGTFAVPVHNKIVWSNYIDNEHGSIDLLDAMSSGSRSELVFNTTHDDGVLYEDVRIKNGNVGIGTTNPEAKLTVKGKIIASEIQVKDIGTIPDYVFRPDYQLIPLNQVEDFVKMNQHLPEVPSEKEFKENGMNVATMNVLLLKKIEELTLYMIEQNNVNKKMEQTLKDQNQKIEKINSILE